MDYKNAGVDIEAGYKSVELMKEHVKGTMRPEVMGGLGGFSGAAAGGGGQDLRQLRGGGRPRADLQGGGAVWFPVRGASHRRPEPGGRQL